MPTIPHDASEMARSAAEGIAALPWFAHAAVALAFGVGILIWLSGWRLMRPAFVLLGMLTGAVAGHVWPESFRFGLDALVFIGVGVAAGGLIGWLLFRMLVAQVLGVVGAVALSLGVASMIRIGPMESVPPREASIGAMEDAEASEGTDSEQPDTLESLLIKMKLDELLAAMRDAMESARSSADAAAPAAEDESIAGLTKQRGVEIVQAFLSRIGEQLWRFWNDDLSPSGRAALLLASVMGYLGGLTLGLLLPRRAAAVTTAALGPAVWIPAGVYLVVSLQLPLAERLPANPALWLLIWLGAFGVGLLFQLFRSRKKPEAKKE